MRALFAIFAAAFFLPSIVFAGQLTEKLDRFNGSRLVSWESFSDPGREYSFNVYAHYADAKDAKPYGYYALLVPPLWRQLIWRLSPESVAGRWQASA